MNFPETPRPVDSTCPQSYTCAQTLRQEANLGILWDEIPIQTKEYLKVVDITDKVQQVLQRRRVQNGSVLLYNPHVTCAVTINENDPELWQDLLEAYPSTEKRHLDG